MPWARMDDHFDDDPDIDDIGVVGVCLFICAITWCSRNLTDGHVPAARLPKLAGGNDRKAVASLLRKQWIVETKEGYHIRNYLKYNPSAEEVLADRAKTAERQTSFRDRKAAAAADGCPPKRLPKSHNASHNAVTDPVTQPVSNGYQTVPVTPLLTGAPVSPVRYPDSQNPDSQTPESQDPDPDEETLGEGVRVEPPARAKEAPVLGELVVGEERMTDQACAPRSPATLQPASKGLSVLDYGPRSPQPSDLLPSGRQPGAVRFTDPWATKVPPTQETVRLHFAGLGETQEQADEFYCHYAGNGWKKGNVPVVNWVMTVESWRKKRSKFDPQPLRPNNGGQETEPLRPNNGGPESRSPRVTPRSAAQGGTLDEQLEYMRQMHARLHRKRD